MCAAVVFAGPSIYGVDREALGGMRLAPPARCGDIYRVARAGAPAIGLIDGIFGSAPSVWHKEILFALSLGVRLYGAASMGALRAAECAPFGMIGVGEIFRSYRDGKRFADADVAVLHAPEEMDFRPLTLALVDAEASLAHLHRCGALSACEHLALLSCARDLHFSERTWSQVVDPLKVSALRKAELLAALKRHGQSVKSLDARALLDRIRLEPDAIVQRGPSAWALQQSACFDVLENCC